MKFKQIRVNYGYHSKLVMVRDDHKEKPTFTKGPWIVKHDKRGLPFIGVKSDPWTYQGTVATVEQEKDARLIAAAPELFAQCKFLEKVLTEAIMTGDSGADLELDQLRELLAKVEGEK